MKIVLKNANELYCHLIEVSQDGICLRADGIYTIPLIEIDYISG